MRIGQPEGLVVHEELDDLTVRHVHDGLASFREAVGFLSVHDGSGFIEAIDECTVFDVGPAFLWAPAQTEVAVPQRQHGFKLGQEFRVKPFFNDVPLVGRAIMMGRYEAFMVDHRSIPPLMECVCDQYTSSSRSCTTRWAP